MYDMHCCSQHIIVYASYRNEIQCREKWVNSLDPTINKGVGGALQSIVIISKCFGL